MKSHQDNNTSKYTSSTPFTSIISPEDYCTNNIQSSCHGNIKFKFANNTLSSPFHYSFLYEINPTYFSSFSPNSDYIVTLPKFITIKMLQDFIFISKNGIGEYEDEIAPNLKTIYNLVKVSEFFQNEKISTDLLSIIVSSYKGYLSNEVIFCFLSLSYKKLSYSSMMKKECDNIWFDIFYICLEKIGTNISLITSNYHSIIKKFFEPKIIEEIINKAFEFLILGNYILIQSETTTANNTVGCEEDSINQSYDGNSDNISSLSNQNERKANFISLKGVEKLLDILSDLRGQKNFFDLMNHEYRIINSQDTIRELSQMPIPTLMIRLPKTVDVNYYEEYSIDISVNGKQIMFAIWYKSLDDTLYISIKLNGDNNDEKLCFKMFTILTVVNIGIGESTNPSELNEIITNSAHQENINYLSNNKSMYTIYKLGNYNKLINEYCANANCSNIMNNNSLVVKIFFKFCYVHSVLASFLLKNFESLSNDVNIRKLPKNLFWLILKNKYLNIKSDNEIINALKLWLDDDLNIKEDIGEILNFIQWNKIEKERIFEFLIKYYNLFPNKTEVFDIISNNCGMNFQYIFEWIFTASLHINYPKLICQLKKKNTIEFMNIIDNIKKESKKENGGEPKSVKTTKIKKNNIVSGTSSFFNSGIENINTNALNSNTTTQKNTIFSNTKDMFIQKIMMKNNTTTINGTKKTYHCNKAQVNTSIQLKPKKMKRIENISIKHSNTIHNSKGVSPTKDKYNYFTLSKNNSFSIKKSLHRKSNTVYNNESNN